MNIGQIARSQQMLYNIINKNGSGSSSQSSASKLSIYDMLNGSGVSNAGSSGTDQSQNFESASALRGTVRDIAQRVYDASFSSDSAAQASAEYTGGDSALQAVRDRLSSRVDSLQQLYQPDQAELTKAFEQRQALAETYANRLQTVPLSDETTQKIQDLALQDAINSAGEQEEDGAESEQAAEASGLGTKDRLSLIREEMQNYAPSKQTAAFNTMNKLWESELDRIGEYIKEKDPNWTTWGDKFDASILEDYKAGVNMWV